MEEIRLRRGDEESFIDKFLGDDSIQSLCDSLRRVPKQRLNLRGDRVTSSGAKNIADLLRVQHSLESIVLEWNELGSTGATYIAESLKVNHSLTQINLQNNKIGSEGAISFAKAMEENRTLSLLDLRWNKIDDHGALAFKNAILNRKPSLQVLLQGNPLSPSTLATITEWMERAHTVKEEPAPIPLPPAPEPLPNMQLEFLQKEIQALRLQVTTLHGEKNDLQRQVDSSSMRITELEQLLIREQYQTSQLSEALKQANLRNSILIDERTALTSAWDKERAELMAEMVQLAREKEMSIKERTLERDNMQNAYDKLGDENSQMRLQFEHLQEQLATAREVHNNELRNTNTRLNESILNETRLRADIAAMKTTQYRLEDRIKLLEEELELTRQEHDKNLQHERQRCNEEIERLKQEHVSLMNALLERNMAQAKEISTLQSLITTLRAELSTQRKELQDAYEASLKEVKESERRRAEELMVDLRQRVELLTVARAELESRCTNLTNELREQAIAHETLVAQLQHQLSLAQGELQRLRTQNQNLRTLQVTLETTNHEQNLEIQELRRKLAGMDTDAKAWYQELQLALQAKASLLEKVKRLERQVTSLQESRDREFDLIQNNVVQCVQEQFAHLRLNLRVGGSGSSNSRPASAANSPHKSPKPSHLSPSKATKQQPSKTRSAENSSGVFSSGEFQRETVHKQQRSMMPPQSYRQQDHHEEDDEEEDDEEEDEEEEDENEESSRFSADVKPRYSNNLLRMSQTSTTSTNSSSSPMKQQPTVRQGGGLFKMASG